MDWTNADTNAFRDYASKTKGRLLTYLRGRVPVVHSKSVEAVALEAMFKEGYEEALRDISSLLEVSEGGDDASLGRVTSM